MCKINDVLDELSGGNKSLKPVFEQVKANNEEIEEKKLQVIIDSEGNMRIPGYSLMVLLILLCKYLYIL